MLKRDDFVRRFVNAGLTYAQAYAAYHAMVGFFEDGVASRSSIRIGHVGVVKPLYRRPRTVTMGFHRDATGVKRVKQSYVIGHRTRYVFRIYKAFGRQHNLEP
jgi:hypothetical protein